MKYLLLVVMGFLSFNMSLYADTVINYDDGSTYTLGEREKIYISTSRLFSKKNYNNGNVYFTLQAEHGNRDYVPQPTDGMAEGSHEWCKAYVPWNEGLTFAMISWQRACDTNNDGEYGCGDDRFDASDDADVCPG